MSLLSIAPLAGVGADIARHLSRPGSLRSPATLSRAQVSSSATAIGADGTTWVEFGADAPRFNGAARRLLIGGQRTNQNTNPRGEGGSGTTLPTGWSASLTALAITSVTQATRNGVSGVLIRFAGTPIDTVAQQLFLGPGETSAIGSVVTHSVFTELVAGSFTNVTSFLLRTGSEAGASFTPGSFARVVHTRTMTATTNRTTLRWNYLDTVTPVDFTVFVGWPQRENGAAFASSPILPPVGTPAATTRGADLVTAALASLGIPAGGACTLLWSGLLPNLSPDAAQVLFQIDAGSEANRYVLRSEAAGAGLALLRANGGATASATLGAITAGTPFRAGVTINASGRAAASLNGATAIAVTGGPTGGLTTLRLGVNAGGTTPMFGETTAFRAMPVTVSDAMLARLVASLPA
jgi:hypothetical protein